MTRINYLKEQIARTERLAKTILDEETANRLRAFAAECRAELIVLSLRAAA
jgi:hypothetical protein